MTENFLMENPLQLFDDFKDIPDMIFKDKDSIQELIAVINSVIESSDYIKILVQIYEKNPTEIINRKKDFEKEIEKAKNGEYAKEKAEIVLYFLEKTNELLDEIISYGGAFKKVPIKVTKTDSEVMLPFYSDNGDACMDVCANKDMVIAPHTTEIVPTGIKVIIPGGYELQIRPRSGLSLKTGIRIANSPATIDSGYRKEVGIIVENTSNTPFEINKYDRIAQLKLSEVPHILWEEISDDEYEKFSTTRGEGFGSSGISTNVKN